jgi:hypothetical protein
MLAKYVRPSKGQKNNFRDAEVITEAVQRPTIWFTSFSSSGEPNERLSVRRPIARSPSRNRPTEL